MTEPLQAVAGEVTFGVVAVAVLGPAQALLADLKVLQGKALCFIIEVVCMLEEEGIVGTLHFGLQQSVCGVGSDSRSCIQEDVEGSDEPAVVVEAGADVAGDLEDGGNVVTNVGVVRRPGKAEDAPFGEECEFFWDVVAVFGKAVVVKKVVTLCSGEVTLGDAGDVVVLGTMGGGVWSGEVCPPCAGMRVVVLGTMGGGVWSGDVWPPCAGMRVVVVLRTMGGGVWSGEVCPPCAGMRVVVVLGTIGGGVWSGEVCPPCAGMRVVVVFGMMGGGVWSGEVCPPCAGMRVVVLRTMGGGVWSGEVCPPCAGMRVVVVLGTMGCGVWSGEVCPPWARM